MRELSQSLNKELLDLVNENYTDFLSLGTALKGGEEKVEEIRVGLLGFERDVRTVRDKFDTRTTEVKQTLDEKKQLRSNIAVGHNLLDIAECIDELEDFLMLKKVSKINNWNKRPDDDGDESDEIIESPSEKESDEEVDEVSRESETPVLPLRRLERHIQKYLYTKNVISRVGEAHPFVVQQGERISSIRTALLLDLKTALKQARAYKEKREERSLAVRRLYELMGEQSDAAAALEELKI